MLPRIDRLTRIKEERKVDAFLLTSPATVKHLSGYFYYFETGQSPFHLIPAALFVVPDSSASLVIADNEMHQAAFLDPEIVIKPYSSYVFDKPLEFTKQFLVELHDVIELNGMGNARIGIEQNSFPFVILNSLTSKFPKIEIVDVTPEIAFLRMVKDPDEIECISRAANLCDVGQTAVLKHARIGITELELFSIVRSEMEAFVATRVPLMIDLISGVNTSSGGGLPTNKSLRSGDLILSDLTPCLNGYWGDSCNTMVIGNPSSAQKKTFNLVKEALEIGINSIRPGVQAKEIDRLMRQHIGNYPHHSGHGIGAMYHEEPRIVPYNSTKLLPNMVIALEPAIYEKDYGIRLEHLVVVTESGCEILTKFQHCFEQFS